jgi:hypothetical protein
MNAEVDESAEERKGGAGALGKMLLSAGEKQLAVVCQVPKALQESNPAFNMKDWVQVVVESTGAKITEEGEEVRRGGRGGEAALRTARRGVCGWGRRARWAVEACALAQTLGTGAAPPRQPPGPAGPRTPRPAPLPAPQLVRLVAAADPDNDRFPLKMRDSAQNACFAYLRTKGLLPADDSDSDDMPPNPEDFGVAW